MKRGQDVGFSMGAAVADRRKRKFFLEKREHDAHDEASKHIEAVEKRGVTFAPMETGFDRYVIKLLKQHWMGGAVRWTRTGGTIFDSLGNPHTTPERMCFALARKSS
jgi:hypothetical protein